MTKTRRTSSRPESRTDLRTGLPFPSSLEVSVASSQPSSRRAHLARDEIIFSLRRHGGEISRESIESLVSSICECGCPRNGRGHKLVVVTGPREVGGPTERRGNPNGFFTTCGGAFVLQGLERCIYLGEGARESDFRVTVGVGGIGCVTCDVTQPNIAPQSHPTK